MPLTEQVIHQTVIRLESIDWNNENKDRLEWVFPGSFMDEVIDSIAQGIRYDYHRGCAEGWDMLDALFEDLGSRDPWPEIAKQVAIVDLSLVVELIYGELEVLAADDEMFSNVTVHACDYELSPEYDGLGHAPVNLFAYDFQDDDGHYSVDAIKEACKERTRALLWIFALL